MVQADFRFRLIQRVGASRRKECPLFNSAGAVEWWQAPAGRPDSRSQAVYRNDFLIPVSYSVGHQHAE